MRRAGIFIGVNKYEDPEISKLDYAENDATELYAFFKHKYSYDIVLQLLSPDSRVLLQEVNRISEELSSGDLLLIYFAGHGMMHTGQQLLLFPKARYDEIEYYQDVIQLELLKKKTRRNGLNSVIILDTCRTQILHGIRGIDTAAMRDVHCMKGIVNAAEGEGAQGVLCSCDEGQQSREIARCRQGVFTLALLGVLQEAMEKGTKVSISDELSEALSEKLVAIGRDYEVQINQRPWFSRSGIIPAIYEPRADSMISQAPEDRKLDISTPLLVVKSAGNIILETKPAEESRMAVMNKRLSRISKHVLSGVLSFGLGSSMIKHIDKTRTISEVRSLLPIMVWSPYWYTGMTFDWVFVNPGQIEIDCIKYIKHAPDLIKMKFNANEGLNEIAQGRKEVFNGIVEDAYYFALRSAYIQHFILGNTNEAKKSLETAILQVPQCTYYLLNLAEAVDIIQEDRERAMQIWLTGRELAKNCSDYTQLAQTNEAITQDTSVSRTMLLEAESKVNTNRDVVSCIEGMLNVNSSVDGISQFLLKHRASETGSDSNCLRLAEQLIDFEAKELAYLLLERLDKHDIFSHKVKGLEWVIEHIQYALLWNMLGDINRANQALDNAYWIYHKQEYDAEVFLLSIAKAYFSIGNRDEGRRLLNEAVQINNDHTRVSEMNSYLVGIGERML